MDYCGIDLGARKTQVCIIDDAEQTLVNKKVDSDISSVLAVIGRRDPSQLRIVAESTFNWDWLVDGLRDAGHSRPRSALILAPVCRWGRALSP